MSKWFDRWLDGVKEYPRLWFAVQGLAWVILASAGLYANTWWPNLVARFMGSALFTVAVALLLRLLIQATLARDLAEQVKLQAGISRKRLKDISKTLDGLAAGCPERITRLQGALESPSDMNLLRSGVKAVFMNRMEAWPHIEESLKGRHEKIWLLGRTLSSDMRLCDHLQKLIKKTEESGEEGLRVLLSDPLRSPAVFRSLLEESPNDVRNILQYYGRRLEHRTMTNPIFGTVFMREFESLWTAIINQPALKKCVRFYAHLSASWIVRIDDTAYYQPLFIAPSLVGRVTASILPTHSPVFKVERGDAAGLFDSIEAHVDTLWNTSDADMLFMAARWIERDRMLEGMFTSRHEWLSDVASHMQGNWQRRSQRHACLASPRPTFELTWKSKENAGKLSGRLFDFAFDSLAFTVGEESDKLKKEWRSLQNRSANQRAPIHMQIHCDEKNTWACARMVEEWVAPKEREMHVVRLDKRPDSRDSLVCVGRVESDCNH